MTCQECRELMAAVALQEASELDRDTLGTHLAQCASCRTEFDRMTTICASLAESSDDHLSEIERLRMENAIYRQLAAGNTPAGKHSRFGRNLVRIAAALLLFALGWFVRPHLSEPALPEQPIAIDRLDPYLAALDGRQLSGNMRFSAAGFKLIAHGRKAAIEDMERAISSRSGRE